MSRVQNSNGVKAVWTLIDSSTSEGQKRSFYFSDGGALKVTRHSETGEKQEFMLPLACLEALKAVAPHFEMLLSEYESRKETIAENKALKDEAARIEKQREKAIKDALLAQIAAQQQMDRVNAFLAQQGIKTVKVG